MPVACLAFVVLPQKPVQGDLGAQDGEEQGEEAVGKVVAPSGVDDQGAGDGQGGDYKEEGYAQNRGAEGTLYDAIAAALALGQAGAACQLFSPFFPCCWSRFPPTCPWGCPSAFPKACLSFRRWCLSTLLCLRYLFWSCCCSRSSRSPTP